VKDNSQDMVFERIEASGIGLTIGSIGSSVVRNITFRDCVMHKPVKGIYMKFRDDAGTIEDVTYENILIDEPGQTAIWIGPAQQSDSDNPCAAHPCSLCWPETPLSKCNLPAAATYKNIVLRNITVNMGGSSKQSFIMANATNPMQGVVFDGVVVNDAKAKDFYEHCEGVAGGIATGGTSPVPPCFATNGTASATEA